VVAQKIWREMKIRESGSGGGGSVRRVKFSPDVNTNGGAWVEGRVAVLEAGFWSGLGVLERLISGFGVFRGRWFPPLVVSVWGAGLSGQMLYGIWNCGAPRIDKEVHRFCFTKWVEM